MLEQESFLKKLAWLADYAGECGNVLTKDEVEKAFSGMELAEQQFDLIYRYRSFRRRAGFQAGLDAGEREGQRRKQRGFLMV